MSHHLYAMRHLALLLTTLMLSACAGAMSDTVIKVELGHSPEPAAHIEVVDLRREATLRRTTIGNISLGAITLSPPETELVRAVVAKALRQAGAAPPDVSCGILRFDIVTPVTALYWDVTARIELILRIGGKERTARGMHVEQTWVYPSDAIIARVTAEALRQTEADVASALQELLRL